MIDLDDLIRYWQDRAKPHPPVTPIPWDEALEATISYLVELQAKRGELI